MYMACNFNCYIENEWLLKGNGSHVHCKSANIWETIMQDRDVISHYYRPIGSDTL